MNKIIFLLYFILLNSCGQSSKYDFNGNAEGVKRELAGISNDSFKAISEVKYNKNKDYHIIRGNIRDAFKDETLNMMDLDGLDDYEGEFSEELKLCYSNKNEDGIKKLNSYYLKYKNNEKYWNYMASCFYLDQKYRRAKILYNKALSLNSRYIPAINNLGAILYKEGKYESSLKSFKKVLKYKNDSKVARYNIANILIQFGHFSKAKKNLDEIPLLKRDRDVILINSYLDIYFLKRPANALKRLYTLNKSDLKKIPFSLALFLAYKLTKNDKSDKVKRYLEDKKLTKNEKKLFKRIIRI